MHPILLQLGPLTIYTYGFFVALGFIVGISYGRKVAAREGIDPEVISDMAFYVIVAAIIGARVLYIATDLHEFIEHPSEVFKVWKGGLVFYGGFIAAFLTGFWYVRWKKLPIWKTADVVALTIPLGQAFGRLGCFSAGCCYGSETDLPWSVTFTDPNSLARLNVPLHPTQIYEAVLDFGIFLALVQIKKGKRFEGRLIWLYVLMYACVRFFVELFRGDEARGSVMSGVLSTSQAIGIGMGVFALIMLWRMREGNK